MNILDLKDRKISNIIKDGDVLLIVPPFYNVYTPSIAVHNLQSYARKQGFRVSILYANIICAYCMGELNYTHYTKIPLSELWGERFFCRKAFSKNAFALDDSRKISIERSAQRRSGTTKPIKIDVDEYFGLYSKKTGMPFDLSYFEKIESGIDIWIDEIVASILEHDYRVVGCTSSFQQISSSIALFNKLKAERPDITTIIGGANCEGEMAQGISSISRNIDYVFDGEGEIAFAEFIDDLLKHRKPNRRVVHCGIVPDLDTIPIVDYSEYYEQMQYFLPESIYTKGYQIVLPYETSRGCWWGQKKQCTFCGMNGEGIEYRKKSERKVLEDIEKLIKSHPSRKILMTDSLIPHSYFNKFFMDLSQKIHDLDITYEIKVNHSFQNLLWMKKAGVNNVQPGVEAFSTSLLKRMQKGANVRKNISFLRNCRSLKINTNYNLLYGIPQDTEEEYQETLSIIRKIKHLEPPCSFGRLSIARCGQYYNSPEKYGIKKIVPIASNDEIFPLNSNQIDPHFIGDYDHFSTDDNSLIIEIKNEIESWVEQWKGDQRAQLVLEKTTKNKYMLLDTRGRHEKDLLFFNEEEALLAIGNKRIHDRSLDKDIIEKLVQLDLLVELDGYYVSLVVASPELYLEMQERYRASSESK